MAVGVVAPHDATISAEIKTAGHESCFIGPPQIRASERKRLPKVFETSEVFDALTL